MKRSDIVATINNLKGEEGHQKVLEVYNSQKPLPRGYKVKNTDAWCATTVSAVFLMNGYSDISECSCPKMIEKAQKLGIWVEDDAYVPKAGDVIMYDWQDSGKGDDKGTADHVGVVIKVDKNKIMVREGNKNNTIGNRDITVDGIHIRGYIVPPYEAQKASEPKKTEKVTDKPSAEKKPADSAQKSSYGYVIGKTYTVNVKTSLNVRKGAGKSFKTVGYANLTPDGKKHSTSSGALLPGTKVTCLEIKKADSEIWIKIPSGWICAVSGNKIFVK
jgi:hypothetical protein